MSHDHEKARFNANFNIDTLRMEADPLQRTVAREYLKLTTKTQLLEQEVLHRGVWGDEHKLTPLTRSASTFIVLPRGERSFKPHWLIELHFLQGDIPSIGIELADNVVLGVMRAGAIRPDLDLTPYGGEERGVSRGHALIQPGQQTLALIDMRSTNGTKINSVRISSEKFVEVKHNDIISLGALSFALRVIATPSELGQ